MLSLQVWTGQQCSCLRVWMQHDISQTPMIYVTRRFSPASEYCLECYLLLDGYKGWHETNFAIILSFLLLCTIYLREAATWVKKNVGQDLISFIVNWLDRWIPSEHIIREVMSREGEGNSTISGWIIYSKYSNIKRERKIYFDFMGTSTLYPILWVFADLVQHLFINTMFYFFRSTNSSIYSLKPFK